MHLWQGLFGSILGEERVKLGSLTVRSNNFPIESIWLSDAKAGLTLSKHEKAAFMNALKSNRNVQMFHVPFHKPTAGEVRLALVDKSWSSMSTERPAHTHTHTHTQRERERRFHLVLFPSSCEPGDDSLWGQAVLQWRVCGELLPQGNRLRRARGQGGEYADRWDRCTGWPRERPIQGERRIHACFVAHPRF